MDEEAEEAEEAEEEAEVPPPAGLFAPRCPASPTDADAGADADADRAATGSARRPPAGAAAPRAAVVSAARGRSVPEDGRTGATAGPVGRAAATAR